MALFAFVILMLLNKSRAPLTLPPPQQFTFLFPSNGVRFIQRRRSGYRNRAAAGRMPHLPRGSTSWCDCHLQSTRYEYAPSNVSNFLSVVRFVLVNSHKCYQSCAVKHAETTLKDYMLLAPNYRRFASLPCFLQQSLRNCRRQSKRTR